PLFSIPGVSPRTPGMRRRSCQEFADTGQPPGASPRVIVSFAVALLAWYAEPGLRGREPLLLPGVSPQESASGRIGRPSALEYHARRGGAPDGGNKARVHPKTARSPRLVPGRGRPPECSRPL